LCFERLCQRKNARYREEIAAGYTAIRAVFFACRFMLDF
jgi:hypothetical protein